MTPVKRGPAEGWPRVAVAGGSVAGLGAGIALHRAGIDVEIFEQDPGPLKSMGAGLVVQPELSALIREPGLPDLPVTRCSGRRHLGFDGSVEPINPMPQQFTSWEAIYATMRTRFPQERYHAGAKVKSVEQDEHGVNLLISGMGDHAADVLIAADGAQSATRRRFLPMLEPRYAGYIAWRGTVRERDLPSASVEAFNDMFTFSDARSGGHALAYFIPGDGLSTLPGERYLNWVWYVGVDERERDSLLVTRDGHQRHASLRRGMAREDVVAALPVKAHGELHPLFAGVIEATADPFLQTIVDIGVARTVFGRTILIGDAAFVVRPHTAGGAAKAARDADSIATALRNGRSNIDIALAGFEEAQIEYGQALLAYGIALGRRWARF